jgi:hypothetical protein
MRRNGWGTGNTQGQTAVVVTVVMMVVMVTALPVVMLMMVTAVVIMSKQRKQGKALMRVTPAPLPQPLQTPQAHYPWRPPTGGWKASNSLSCDDDDHNCDDVWGDGYRIRVSLPLGSYTVGHECYQRTIEASQSTMQHYGCPYVGIS